MAGDLVSFLSAAGDEILILLHLFLHSSQTQSHLSNHSWVPCSPHVSSPSSSLDGLSSPSASSFTSLCPLAPLSLASRPLLRLLSDASASVWPLTLPLPHFFLPSSVSAFCPSAAAFALAPTSQLSVVWPPFSLKRQWDEGETGAAGARPQGEEGRGRRAPRDVSRKRGAVSSPAPPEGRRQQPGNCASKEDTEEWGDFVDRLREDPSEEEANDGDKRGRISGLRPPDRSSQTDPPADRIEVYVHPREAATSAVSAARAQSPVSRLEVEDVDRTFALRVRGETESERPSSRPLSSVLVAFENSAGTPGTGTPRLDGVSDVWRREETEEFGAEWEGPALVALSSLPLHAASCGGKPADEDLPRREQRGRARLHATIESVHCPPLLCLGETRLVLHRASKVSLFRLPSLSIVSEFFPPFVASASAADFLSISLSAAPTASRSSSPPPRRLESVVFLLACSAPQRGRDSLCWFSLYLRSARDGRRVLLAVPQRSGAKAASCSSPFAASDAQTLPSNAFASERNGEDEEERREIRESLKLAGRLPSTWHVWSNDQFIVAMQRHCYQTPRLNAAEEEEREEEGEEEEEDDEREEKSEEEADEGEFDEEPRDVIGRRGGEGMWRGATAPEQREMKIRKKRLYTVVFWRIRGLYRNWRGGEAERPPAPDAPDSLLRLRDRESPRPSRDRKKSTPDRGGRHRELKELTRAGQEDREREEDREQAGERKEGAEEGTAEGEEEGRLLMVLGRKRYRIAGRWGCAEDLLLWSPSESLELHITRLAREQRRQNSSSFPRDSRRTENATDWRTSLEALPGLAAEFGGFSALAVSPVRSLHPLPSLVLPGFGASPVAKERERRSSLSSDSRRATTDDWASSDSLSSDSDATDLSVLSASLFSSPSSSPASSASSSPKAAVSFPGSRTPSAQSPHPVHRRSSTRTSFSPTAFSSSFACPSPASISWSPSSSVSVVSPRTFLVAAGCSAGALLVGLLHRTPRPHTKSPSRQPVRHSQAPPLYSSASSSPPSTSLSCVSVEGGQRGVSAQVASSRFRGSGEVREEESEFSFEVLWCINGEFMDGWRVDSLAIFLDAGILVATHDFSRAFDLRSGRCLSQFPSPAFRSSDAALRYAEVEGMKQLGRGAARDSPAEQPTEDRDTAGSKGRNGCRDRRERGDRGQEREAGETIPVAVTVGGGGRRVVCLSISREATERHAGHVDYVLESVDFAPPSSAPLPCELLSPSSSAADSSLPPWKDDHEKPETAVGGARDPSGVHTAEDCTRWWCSCRGCRAAPGNLREAETGQLFCSPLCFEATQCTYARDSKADTKRSCAAETSPPV
ncbi:UNVERIFIED_CONTAM: hypothetical protein HHA_232320 [Hammondia hammondi]|eukprot:XP_008885618.1 hypothetical protein HHA_232320 [Hammondia hammondi]